MHPDAHIELVYSNPWELLVATILSAQCTDARVNIVTKELFAHVKTPKQYAELSQAELENFVKSAGFFRQKAKNIRAAALAIVEEHGGKVPQTMDEIVKLPGVGRKTANVVLGNAFSTPGLPVDTHVTRLSNRIGLTTESDAVKIEHDLMAILEPKHWTQFSHALIFHGRRICKARSPQCEECLLQELCDYFKSLPKEKVRSVKAKEDGRSAAR